jgi:hypothetical protein
MERQSNVIRFQEGIRTRHPPPEANIEPLPPDTPTDAGTHLAVMVDLSPPLPHRSREIRVIAAETYWTTNGSVVARLRRALAEANRYLARANANSSPDQKTSGSITCVAFFDDEMFIGQVGPGHAILYQAKDGFETFPQDDEPLLPLGAAVPPVIHIGYADVASESTLLLTTTEIAESMDRRQWMTDLSSGNFMQVIGGLSDRLVERGQTGSIVLFRYTKTKTTETSASRRRFPLPRRRGPGEQLQPEAVGEGQSPPHDVSDSVRSSQGEGTEPKPSSTERVWTEEETSSQPRLRFPKIRLPKVRLPQIQLPKWRSKADAEGGRTRKLPRINLKPAFKTLLPGKVEGSIRRRRRRVPEERSTVMAGLTIGFLLIILLITVTTYFQPREDALLEQADGIWQTALETQDVGDWKRLARISDQILALDPQNPQAQMLRDTAQKAIEATENATILNATPIMELGTSPSPRRLVVAQSWIYVLNPATDEVRGLSLKADGIVPGTDAPTPILRAGQTLPGTTESVGSLVDIAWMAPGPGYPDGAIFIYSTDGYLYIYEPHIGPGNIDRQRLTGAIEPRATTLVETYGEQFYALDRQANQVWKYTPVNGVYDGEPRPYFAEETAPQLQTALAMELDGRLYLLLGDGVLHTYFRGTEDTSFTFDDVPVDDFHPTVMTVDTTSDEGLIYLGDPRLKMLVALNKRGQYQNQFRIANDALEKLEALAISRNPDVLYFVAANRLHAAPLPAAVTPQ